MRNFRIGFVFLAATALFAGQAGAFFFGATGGSGCSTAALGGRWIDTENDSTIYDFRADGTVGCVGSCNWTHTPNTGKKVELGRIVVWELQSNDTLIKFFYSGGSTDTWNCSIVAKGKILNIEGMGTYRRGK